MVCTKEIKVHKSQKRGFGKQESQIITRGKTSYLRIVGLFPNYTLMTATASEDDGSFYVCREKSRLIASAIQLRFEKNAASVPDKDSSGRNFIKICSITFDPSKEQEDQEKELSDVIERFFEIFDGCNLSSTETQDEMKEIYKILAVDDSNDDLYLSDGVWLSSSGHVYDRGR